MFMINIERVYEYGFVPILIIKNFDGAYGYDFVRLFTLNTEKKIIIFVRFETKR